MMHDPNEPLPHDFDWNELYAGDERDYMPPDPLMVELIEALEPGHALDVGCGAGGLLAAMAERGWVISGIDVAANAIEAARRVLGQRGADATLEVADAATWRPPRTYDLVTNCFAMPMLRAQQVRAFETLREAVAPGGHVIIEELDPQMSRLAAFAGFDHISVEHLSEAFAWFEILRAEVVPTPAHDHGQGSLLDERWTASLLVARRPG